MFKQNQIIFIGPKFTLPKGGIAFVLSEYHKLFPDSYFVASTISKNKLTKIVGFIFGITKLLFLLISKKDIKIVHIHGASYNSFKRKRIIHSICKLFNKQTIYHIHGGGYQEFYLNSCEKKKRKIASLINNTDCLICLSESWKVFFTNNFSPKRIEIIPNIIAAPNQKQENHKNTKPLVFQFLGFIDGPKGVWLLLETIKQHKQELLGKVVFNIGGNGKTDKLQRLIKEYRLEEIVFYNGWVSGKLKQQLLNDADVYILPSYNEGLPISILEAMSYSLPILSTSVGGIPEIVSDDNGILIEPGDKTQLWTAIEYFIYANKSILNKMGQISKGKAKPHLPDEVEKKLIKLYKTI